MAMDLNAKAAYIRGLMTGMEFDPASKNSKVIAAMMDLLEEMAAQVVEHDNALDQDVDDIVSDLYADDDEDDDAEEDSDEGLYEVTCPNCGKVSTVDEETLLDQTQELVCPYCNASFDIELEGTEDEQPEDNDQ